MKKEYSKPELDTKVYAQFENVFTACNKVKKNPICTPGFPDPPSGSEYCKHTDIGSY